MLTLKHVSKEFHHTSVLRDISVEFTSGLHFILGASGSGKSTLLKLMSGMDTPTRGDVLYNGTSLATLTPSERNDYYYNTVGFVWQNFQLLNHLSVEDNVKAILQLSPFTEEEKNKKVNNVLHSLGLSNIAKKKVTTLSGGQKQRVAIGRVLVKDPEVIIADEPTGALDKKSAQIILSILKKIARERTVIIVTHDKSLIAKDDNVFVLDDGELVRVSHCTHASPIKKQKKKIKPSLSIKNAAVQGMKNIKGMAVKFLLLSFILMLSSYFLLLNVSGNIGKQQEDIFHDLTTKYGNELLNISIISEFMQGSSTDSEDDNNTPGTVKQDISHILKKYETDERIQTILATDNYRDIKVSIDGVTSNYSVMNSGQAGGIFDVTEGRYPEKNKMEVAIPKSMAKKITNDPSSLIGKEMSLEVSTVTKYPDDPYDPTQLPTFYTGKMKVKIVGLIDASLPPYEGMTERFELDDAFIVSYKAASDFRKDAGKNVSDIPINIRAKDLQSVIELSDELMKEGIVPLGRFEEVKDILKLNDTTSNQSTTASGFIAVIALIVSCIMTFIHAYLRKSEHAILKVNGYSKGAICTLTIVEYVYTSFLTCLLFTMFLPIINTFSMKIFGTSLTNDNGLLIGFGIIFIQGIVMGSLSSFYSLTVNPITNLKTGDS